MAYNYQYKITFELNQPFDIDFINNACKRYSDNTILVEVQNTKGITSDMLRQLNPNIYIRVAGGYDKDRVERRKDVLFNGGETGRYYTDAVIYTRNETIKIVEEMERIEKGINNNWSDIQKLIYVYDRLKSGIMYDPEFEQRPSDETRSLRGLLTRQTVCAGYSMILKELMDRNGIDCEYVEGYTKTDGSGAHAWNIVNIDGKKYPIDLTWDNSKYRSGNSKSYDWLGQDVDRFSESHFPDRSEKTQDYKQTLSQIDPEIIKKINNIVGVNRARDYRATTYYCRRKDGSRFIIAKIGDNKIDDTNYYRYYFTEINPDGSRREPIILYSETNVMYLIDCKKFGKEIPKGYEEAVCDVLFSRDNIVDSLTKGTYYIGQVRKNSENNKLELVSSVDEIDKQEDKIRKFRYPTKCFRRSDGSIFIAQQMLKKPFNINDVDVMRYDIFEMVNENGKEVLKRNTVFTERNMFNDSRQEMIDDYLSRDRLDRKANDTGGYIGYYDANGIRMYNPDLVRFFETSRQINIDDLNEEKQKVNNIPSFEEIRELVSKYEIYIDINENSNESSYKIRDIRTGQIQTDKNVIDRAMFANLWLSAAGIKYYSNEARPGEKYAFNDNAEKLYKKICGELVEDCRRNGVIDTTKLFGILKDGEYKHNAEIIANLFRTPYQTQMINRFFLKSLGIKDNGMTPTTLYTPIYANGLLNEGAISSGRGR